MYTIEEDDFVDSQTKLRLRWNLGRYGYYLTRVNLLANHVLPNANEDDEGADKKAAKTEESYELEACDALARSRTRQGEGRDEAKKKMEETGERSREERRRERRREMKDEESSRGPYHGYHGPLAFPIIIPRVCQGRKGQLVLGTEGKVNPIASRKRGDLLIDESDVRTFRCWIVRISSIIQYQFKMWFILSWKRWDEEFISLSLHKETRSSLLNVFVGESNSFRINIRQSISWRKPSFVLTISNVPCARNYLLFLGPSSKRFLRCRSRSLS